MIVGNKENNSSEAAELQEDEMLMRAIAMSLEVNENSDEGHVSITQKESGVSEPSKLPPMSLVYGMIFSRRDGCSNDQGECSE